MESARIQLEANDIPTLRSCDAIRTAIDEALPRSPICPGWAEGRESPHRSARHWA